MADAKDIAIAALKPVIARAAENAASQSVGLDAGDAAQITNDVTKEVAAVVVNQTNNEPWYQSRVTWGAILAALAGILGMFGYALPDDLQGKIVEGIVKAGPLIAAALTLYGRWVAKKPIGE